MSSYYLRQDTHLGKESTIKLNNSVALIVGLGGLGSGVAQILARMGVGHLILVDNDVVQEHNLSRQQLYTIKDVDSPKVLAAKRQLEQINPNLKVKIHIELANKEFYDELDPIDIIIDCTDRHESRRDIDTFAIKNSIPWIHGAAVREQGVVCVFGPNYTLKSYEDIYKDKNVNEFCEGVIATTTSLVSSLQASLAIKVLLKQRVPKSLLRINLEEWTFNDLNIK